MRVLIVDDKAPAREAIRQLLERRGHVVGEAEGAREAVDALTCFAPDLVLVDLRLGDASGYAVAEALTAASPGVAVVLVSMSDSADPDRVRASGARAFVRKDRLLSTDLAALSKA